MVRGFQAPLPFPRSGLPSASRGVGFGLAACARGTSFSRPPIPPCAANRSETEVLSSATRIQFDIPFLMIVYVRGYRHMDRSRREFLTVSAAGVACVGLESALDAAAEPVLGMIFPPANYEVPPEAKLMYPKGIRFLAE